MRFRSGLVVAIVSLALGVSGGCDQAGFTRVVVRGKIHYQRVPLCTGMIVFTPDASRGSHGCLACGEVQADGSYELRTENGPGAAAGWYHVSIASVDPGALPAGGPAQLIIPRSLLPEKYRDPELSGLVREVKAGGENTIDFDLE
jgi:hypothetical protein